MDLPQDAGTDPTAESPAMAPGDGPDSLLDLMERLGDRIDQLEFTMAELLPTGPDPVAQRLDRLEAMIQRGFAATLSATRAMPPPSADPRMSELSRDCARMREVLDSLAPLPGQLAGMTPPDPHSTLSALDSRLEGLATRLDGLDTAMQAIHARLDSPAPAAPPLPADDLAGALAAHLAETLADSLGPLANTLGADLRAAVTDALDRHTDTRPKGPAADATLHPALARLSTAMAGATKRLERQIETASQETARATRELAQALQDRPAAPGTGAEALATAATQLAESNARLVALLDRPSDAMLQAQQEFLQDMRMIIAEMVAQSSRAQDMARAG